MTILIFWPATTFLNQSIPSDYLNKFKSLESINLFFHYTKVKVTKVPNYIEYSTITGSHWRHRVLLWIMVVRLGHKRKTLVQHRH